MRETLFAALLAAVAFGRMAIAVDAATGGTSNEAVGSGTCKGTSADGSGANR